MSGTESRLIASFGRRSGRKLKPAQAKLVKQLLPQLQITLPEQGYLVPEALFPHPVTSLQLEIGFGGGEHLAEQARRNPEAGFIGCEPFIDGVARLLGEIDRDRLTNIRLWSEDARLLLPSLPEGSVDRTYLLFPDPWPKARHHKRRIINQQTLGMLARCIRPGGELLLATDHADYATWMLEHLLASPDFQWMARVPEDFNQPPPGWVETRYQRKTTAQGRHPLFFLASRL